ncbi:MAG TPA: hypothetical protein VGR70_13505 [Stellaceae bacterium]|nr:hypothetical protein [Stellaceae bacterium]
MGSPGWGYTLLGCCSRRHQYGADYCDHSPQPNAMLTGFSLIKRTAAGFVGIVAFIAIGGLWLAGAHSAYEHLLALWGIVPFRYPFVDVDGSLAAWECARKGVDVIIADPCDVLQRGYNYSPFWMTLSWIPLDRADRITVGVALGLSFLISLWALPPPLSRGEMLLRVSAVLSTMVVFAIERANPDLLIFIFVVIILELLRRSTTMRGFAYGLAFLAGAIKYYPFVLLGLAVRERFRFFIAVALGGTVGLVLFWQVYATQLLEGLPRIAVGVPYGDMFGAKNIPVGLFDMFQTMLTIEAAAKVSVLTTLTLLAAIVCLMFRLSLNGRVVAALRGLDEPRRLALLAGALLLSGCFVAGQNVAYRGIFLLLVLPGTFALGRARISAVAPTSRVIAAAIPCLMWAEAIRLWIHLAAVGKYPPPGFMSVLDQPVDFIAWCGREIAWWFVIGFLLTILLNFAVHRVFAIIAPRHERLAAP